MTACGCVASVGEESPERKDGGTRWRALGFGPKEKEREQGAEERGKKKERRKRKERLQVFF